MSTLDKIIAYKKKEIEKRISHYPVKLLEQSIYFDTDTVSLKKYVTRNDKWGIIAEIKRKSPSKGMINPYVSIERTSIGYMQAGASALSILTDQNFFGGSNEDLTVARKFNYCPILRKEFIVHEYQLVEAKSIGADAVLLIASVLSPETISRFVNVAHSLKLEVLLEVHDIDSIKANENIPWDLIGVNNRDLKTFEVNLATSKKLSEVISSDRVKVSESGIDSVDDIVILRKYGYQGFLVGERFMKHSRPEAEAMEFIKTLKRATH